MRTPDRQPFTRRDFIATGSALGAASLLGLSSPAAAEPPPEITSVRIAHWSAICMAPQYVAEALLRAEGFTEIQYLEGVYRPGESFVGPGKADFDMDTPAMILTYLDAGAPLVTLTGVHLGCYELFGTERVRSIRNLKGKIVPVDGLSGAKHVAQAPERAARLIIDKGFTQNYDYALETLRDVHYNVWRTYDPEDTLRFNALRLREVGMIKSTPQELIAQGTDWRVLNELKKELKA